MAYYITKDTDLKKVGDAIREKGGTTDTLFFPSGMVTAIGAIPSGGTDTLVELNNDTLTSYIFPSSVTALKSYLFYKNTKLLEVSGKGVESLGDYCFYDSNIRSVDFPELTSVGPYSFYNCLNLKEASFPKLLEIKDYGFNSCKELTELDFPLLKSLGSYCFTSCSSLKSVSFEKIEYFGIFAFRYCSSLTSVNAPACKSVPQGGFSTCTSLKLLKIFPLCTSIGNSAFYSCTGLTTLFIPEKTTSIAGSAFNKCTNLTDVYTPLTERPSEWNASAFPSTTTIHYGVTEAEYDEIIKEEQES